jgi:hypothetical protein
MSNPKLTLRQVSSCDTVAYVARLMLLFAWLMLFALILYIAAGGKKPVESPGEIALGMTVLTAAFLLVIAVRRNSLSRLAAEGIPVSAELFHTSHYQFFMTLGLHYMWRGVAMKKTVQIPYGSATRFIEGREQVILIIDRDDPRRFIIGDIYSPDTP